MWGRLPKWTPLHEKADIVLNDDTLFNPKADHRRNLGCRKIYQATGSKSLRWDWATYAVELMSEAQPIYLRRTSLEIVRNALS